MVHDIVERLVNVDAGDDSGLCGAGLNEHVVLYSEHCVLCRNMPPESGHRVMKDVVLF